MRRLARVLTRRSTRPKSWVVTESNPPAPDVLPSFRFFAVLGTWMEDDIVVSTVKNALTQGCERVYLVDNGSTDATIESACAAGATLARSFVSDRYDEGLRLAHMNEVVQEVSEAEAADHVWWMFLDGDEFPHGPSGMTVRDYLRTLDRRFRVVGARFFDHFPSTRPYHVPGQHPIDHQPLCQEVSFGMCAEGHRKHPLQRWDRGAAPITCNQGFHSASCDELLVEPSQPIFLHHFPYRDEEVTRRRLGALWAKDASGSTRAVESRDTHMLARVRSLDAVYSGSWARVENFLARHRPQGRFARRPALYGVRPRPWAKSVSREHRDILRWESTFKNWRYGELPRFTYGDRTSYERGIQFLDGHGDIEDWGCGFADARAFVRTSKYIGLDGSSQYADRIVDLEQYRSEAPCIFMRHVLEHNAGWRRILENALSSFQRRMVLVIYTPFVPTTRIIATSTNVTSTPVPEISFRKEDLTELFSDLVHIEEPPKETRSAAVSAGSWREESLRTQTKYGVEHIFYLER
jgi:hypothetical protein